MTNHRTSARGKQSSVALAVRRALGCASVTLALTASLAAGTAGAQEQQANPQGTGVLQEVTVTGTRIQREDGYEAPTPVSVLGTEQLNQMATTTIADAVNRLPAFAGSVSPRTISSNVGTGTAGVNALNLRGLGANRTLVLLDGKRIVGSSLGTGGNASAVDVNSMPAGLVQRVEVVTGGASAVYGSDALAGVVNFVLDKTFTGVKGSVEGGESEAGDGENYKFSITAGTGFADDRGHLLFSGEHSEDKGVIGNNRSWADNSFQMMNNPNYRAGNGQPQLLNVTNAGVANGTKGGLILGCSATIGGAALASCPFRGTQFGPGGTPLPFQFGSLVSGPIMSGGDWEDSRVDRTTTLALPLAYTNAFGRASFDVTDNFNVYTELQYSTTKSHNKEVVPNLNNGGLFIKSGNPFIPASVQAQMTAQGIQQLELGTFNGDMPYLQGINEREFKRYVVGAEGNFDLIGANWKWDSYYTHNQNDIESWTPGDRINANYNAAVDAIVDPVSGKIVCRGGDPACVPYNPMGLGVNSAAAVNYVTGTGYSDTLLKQDVIAASVNGEPFSTWAGPVSIALGAEHRRESVEGSASALDEANAFFAGNYHATQGKYNVTEGFVETVVPLLKDLPFAQSLDFNGAVRYTDYSTSGNVTTWKAGAVWTPIEDMRFRVTRSRDIRAPNLGELFNAGQSGTGNNVDPFLNQSYFMLSRTSGNPDLKPEEANTTGIGVVLAPRFLPGFTMSVDYYNIKIDGAIATVSTTNILNQCFAGNQLFCSFIDRGPDGKVSLISVQPANILGQEASGLDVDASYDFRLPVGDLRLRALASFVSKLDTNDLVLGKVDGRGINSDDGGIGLGTALSAPKYRYLTSATYTLDPVAVTLSMRGISSGVYNNAFIVCQSDCPTATALNPTINDNHIDGVQYFDLSTNYKVGMGELFFVIENLTNEDPPLIAGGRGAGFYQGQSSSRNYDRFGRTYHAGVRFSF